MLEVDKKLIEFSKKRGWNPTAQDIAKSIIIEAAELLEHYQFDDTNKFKKRTLSKDMEKISLEVVDVYWYLVQFCNKTGVDLKKALVQKLKVLEVKYPEKMFNGKFNSKVYNKQKALYRKEKIKVL